MNLSKKIKNLRIQKGISQNELAEVLNVTYQTVSKWENEINTPDIHTLKNLASYFGISIDSLLDNDNIKKFCYDVNFNIDSEFSVWTDFLINGKSAPESINNKDRHITGSKLIFSPTTSSGGKRHIYFVIDKNGKVIYLSLDTFGFSGLNRLVGYFNDIDNLKQECYLLMDNYQEYKANDIEVVRNKKWLNCEFVIPHNGFVITLEVDNRKSLNFMESVLSSKTYRYYNRARIYGGFDLFFKKILLPNDLDDLTFYILNDRLVVEAQNDFSDFEDNVTGYLNKKLEELTVEYESLFGELKMKVEELKDEYESTIEELKQRLEELEKEINNLRTK